MANRVKALSYYLILLTGLTGCANQGPNAGRYHLKKDRLPAQLKDVSRVSDATPRYEPYSAGGNSNYQIRGKAYHIIEDARDFTQTGLASWYGEKFHGHATANGEIYDMYAMTAAHKRLPLPSYLKVSNLDNGRQVIVRVNDRGPFHQGRIIDLSYAAAKKLDIVAKGTGRVSIEVITIPPPWQPQSLLTNEQPTQVPTAVEQVQLKPVAPPPERLSVNGADIEPAAAIVTVSPPAVAAGPSHYIQVVATSNPQRAKLVQQRLTSLFEVEGRTLQQKQVHKVQLGPFENAEQADRLLEFLKRGEFSGAFRVYEN